jgi:phenylacetate-CoA ligase
MKNDPIDISEALCAHVRYCAEKSPYYRTRIDATTLTSENAEMFLQSLPCTTKADLEAHNDAFCAVPMREIVDIVMSSGTTGKATKVVYTQRDLDRLAYNERVSFEGCGMTADDIVLLTCTIDRCFIAGLAYFLGLKAVGAAVIRNGHGTMQSHLQMLLAHRPTAIVGVPTFVRKLAEYAASRGHDPKAFKVSKVVCIGEPLRDKDLRPLAVTNDIERLWGAKAYSTYASSETITTFCECSAQAGGHLISELAYLEILDDDNRALHAGSVGEVVVTPLGIEGMPLIRFKTGDLSFIIDEPCSCGRKSRRLGPIIGRKNQMLKVKGTTVYPPAIFDALSQMADLDDYYAVVRSDDALSDAVTVHCTLRAAKTCAEDIAQHLQAVIRVRLDVVIEDAAVLRLKVYDPQSRKPLRFFDMRTNRV